MVLDQHYDDDLSTDTMEIMMLMEVMIMMLMKVTMMKKTSLSDIRVVVPGKSQWNAAG